MQKERLIELLLPYYTKGNRQALIFALCGLLRKKGISEEMAEKIVRALYEKTGDEDPLNQRLSAVRLTYQKGTEEELLGWKGLKEFLSEEDLKKLESFFQKENAKRSLKKVKRGTGGIQLDYTLNQLCVVLKNVLVEKVKYVGYSPDLEGWLVAENGTVWEEITEKEFLVFLRNTVEENFMKIVKATSGKYSNQLIKFLTVFLQKGTYSNEILQTLQVLMRLPQEIVFGYSSLCVYSPSFKIEFTNPENWMFKLSPTYQNFGTDPHRGEPEKFLEFLNRLFGDKEKVEFFRRILAYSLLSGAKRKIVFIIGEAGTGKSTLATILQEVFGKYAGVLPKGVLIGSQADNIIQPHFKVLNHAKLIFIHELSSKDILNSEKIKLITGGDTLSWRNPHSCVIHEIRAEALLIALCNSKPQFSTLDTAITERIEYLYTKERLPFSQRRMNFAQEILDTEKGTILNWILEALSYVQVHPHFWESSPFKIYKIRELILKDLCLGLWEFATIPDPRSQVELKELVDLTLQVLEKLNLKDYFQKKFNVDEEGFKKSLEIRFGIFIRNFNPSALVEKRTMKDRAKLVLGYRLNKEILDVLPVEEIEEEQDSEIEIPF